MRSVKIPPPLVDQLKESGKLITPCGIPNKAQDLILLEKNVGGDITIKAIEKVLYVSLQGEYGS